MLDARERKAIENIRKAPKLMIAHVKTRKRFIIEYINRDGYRTIKNFDNQKDFFDTVELLVSLKRKFRYAIVDDSYITLR